MADIHSLLNRNLFIPLYDLKEKNKRLKYVGKIEAFNSLSRDELESAQWQSTRQILKHASENIPFYRKKYGEAGVSWRDIRTPEDLTNIPTLTRDDIRGHGPELLADGVETDGLVESATGGTISSPIALYLSRDCMDMRLAATVAFNKWFGYELGDKAVFLWGAAQDFPELVGIDALKARIRNALTNRILWMPTSYLDDSILAGYYELLCKYKPAVIQAYPTPLYLFAKYMWKNDLSYKPKTITVAAETLYDYQREQIESVFQCKVFDWYGSRELGHMASECAAHNGLHVNAFHLFIESISGDKQVLETEGSLVVTDLKNMAMPLIRYEIGDVGVISKRACPCGSSLPILERVSGRLVDTFVTASGGRVPGVALTNRVIKDCQGIEQMQVIQEDFEQFTIRIVKGKDFTNLDLKKLESAMHGYFDTGIHIDYDFVEAIPLEKSGKSRFCICRIDEEANSATSYETARTD